MNPQGLQTLTRIQAMNANRIPRFLLAALAALFLVDSTAAAPRHRPANPRGVADPRGLRDPRGIADPRGVADPRGLRDPRGVADPRGAFDPRGPFDPRNPAAYMYTLPAAAATRVFAGVTYYVLSGIYYYPYYINGQVVYVKAVVHSVTPTVPPRPY
jgi:hypothetical protein